MYSHNLTIVALIKSIYLVRISVKLLIGLMYEFSFSFPQEN